MKSVLEQVYTKDAESMEIAGRNAVKGFGKLEDEYKALREGAMIYDCSNYGFFKVYGEGSDEFLENLCTKDIQYLNVGNISECYFLNEDAEIIGSVFVYRREEDFMIITPWEHGNAVKEWLEAQINQTNTDVKVEVLEGKIAAISVEGPQSWKLVKNIFDFEIETLALRYAEELSYNGENITVLRIGRSTEYGYMIIATPESGKAIYEALTEAECDFPVEEGGVDCLELAMLEVHQPNFRKETKEYGNILELEQQWYIQYDKEDYVGKEKLMGLLESGAGKNAVGFTGGKGDTPYLPGCHVSADGEVIGKVVYSSYSLKLDCVLGIAVLDKPFGQSGMDYEVQTENGTKPIHTVSAPFVRPLSWDLKME